MIHFLPLLAITCLPAGVPPAAQETTETEVNETVGRAGLEVVVDPVTGAVVSEPTYSQFRDLSDADATPRRSAWKLREFSLPHGGRGVFLDGWADHSVTIEVTADGEMRTVCPQGDSHPQPPASPEANDR